jgi:hypothetical protein
MIGPGGLLLVLPNLYGWGCQKNKSLNLDVKKNMFYKVDILSTTGDAVRAI